MTKMNWQTLISPKRLGREVGHEIEEYRSVFQRDFDRLIFSAPFRRMQNKTQVFPLPGSIFVHNRLTHSLEVSSVGRSLGNDVGRELSKKYADISPDLFASLGSIVSAACLAHDMGNPPFGHSGEDAIISFFKEGEGKRLATYEKGGDRLTEAQWNDLTHFDGNANTFRLLTHQFAGRRPGGFVMTYATLASVIKYPYSSSATINGKPKFGFFDSEREDFLAVAEGTGMICKRNSGEQIVFARHPLVFLVEAADDICYQIMDIEDAHKLHLLSDEETLRLLLAFFDEKQQAHIRETFGYVTDVNERIVYLRAAAINELEHACVEAFMAHEEAILCGELQQPLIKLIKPHLAEAYRCCAEVARQRIYRSRDVVDIELSGYHIIHTLLGLMTNAVLAPEESYSRLLISRVSKQYQLSAPTLYGRLMAVLDYITGMTDVYALDLYRKINGHSLPMV